MEEKLNMLFRIYQKKYLTDYIKSNTFETKLLKVVLYSKDDSVEDIYETAKNELDFITKNKIYSKLKEFGLNDLGYLRSWKEQTKYHCELFRKLKSRESKNRNDYNTLNGYVKIRKTKVDSKALLILIFNENIFSRKISSKGLNTLNGLNRIQSESLLKEILRELGIYAGFRKDIKRVEGENADLKISLEDAKQEITNLQEKIIDLENSKTDSSRVIFLKEINSNENNNLLDQFAISLETIRKLKEEGYKFPPELKSIPMNIKLFNKYLESIGVEKIYELDRILEIDEKQSEEFEYIGTPFTESEKKKVKVIKSGWKYMDTVIATPEVKEINN